MSKQYLSGTLTSKEMYEVEDRLLENDFYFEAMEGLELLPWERCQKAIDEVETQIIDKFSVKPGKSWGQTKIVLSLVSLLAVGMAVSWIFGSQSETIDLTPETSEIQDVATEGASSLLEKAKPKEELAGKNPAVPERDSSGAVKKPSSPVETSTQKQPSSQPGNTNRRSPTKVRQKTPVNPSSLHIAIGRVVDVKGIALQNVLIQVGSVSDTTDKSGYFALKIPLGINVIQVKHLGFVDQVEIDTNQSWEIVLDIAQGKVENYYPINAANRFK